MKKILFLLFSLTFFYSFSQKKKFNFNENIFIKYAITGMEEYDFNTGNKVNFLNNYDTNKPLVYGKIVDDCNEKNHKIVLVVFKDKTASGCAFVYMTYTEDDYFDTILNRGTSITSAKQELEGFKSTDATDFLFGCGI